MTVQVLVATMGQTDHSLLEKMNIQTDVIVGNQCDRNEIEEFEYNGHRVLWLSFSERGVGLNRNNALMRADADICLLADDDMVFADGYEKTVTDAFAADAEMDVAVFNLPPDDAKSTDVKKNVGKLNYMRYGAARVAFRRQKVSYAGIFFNQNFGGGTKHSCGEDTIFLHDCLYAGLKMKHLPAAVASLDTSSESTWFKGYNEKYFYDMGVLYSVMYGKKALFMDIQYLVRHRNVLSADVNFKKALTLMKEGNSAV